MSVATWFGWGSNEVNNQELPFIFPLAFKKELFIEIDVINIYQKILTDVVERTHGLSDEQSELLWDNCLQSESSHGLISVIARAMTFRRELFLVYDKAINIIRKATSDEEVKIREDYKKSSKSSVGVFISFTHYHKSQLVELYSALEYCTIAALHKSMNLSAAIQLKMTDLRQSTGLNDSAEVKAQAVKIARALGNGRDVMLDAKDIIENAVPDISAVEAAIEYLNEKRAFYLGMPASYICGEQTGGIGSTGESDTKAIERGLKNYYNAIIKPVFQAIFGVKPSYKSQDFRQIDQAMNAMKTFALTDESLISLENKTLILNKLLDLPEDSEGTEPPEPKVPDVPPGDPNAKKTPPQPKGNA